MKILNETDTIKAAQAGVSLARYGDGELRLCLDGTAISQRTRTPKLIEELREILLTATPGVLVCIPDFNAHGPNRQAWQKYARPEYLRLFGKQVYGSAFVTRPDNAPWINTPEYWAQVQALWQDKDVILVTGFETATKSLHPGIMPGARTMRRIYGPHVEAYDAIELLQEQIVALHGVAKEVNRDVDQVVILCLGATATVLAWRLARLGIHALDLGHVGMFMQRLGVTPNKLISDEWRKQNALLHSGKGGFGGSGYKHKDVVHKFSRELGVKDILDYGCGEGTLRNELVNNLKLKERVYEYDPAIPAKAQLPKPADLVVCTDVLEHVEPDRLAHVIQHLYDLTKLGAYIVIATRPANKIMPNGVNAHLLVESGEWWVKQLEKLPWNVVRSEVVGHKETGKQKEVRVWIHKQ